MQAVYAGVLILWDIYAAYGDRRIFEENYAAMCRYTRFESGELHYEFDAQYCKPFSKAWKTYV